MTVHMFRVCVSESGLSTSELESAIQTWVDTHTKWEGSSTPFSVSLTRGIIEDSTTEYYSGDFRFEQTDAKENILQKLTDKLDNKVDWYRIGYHTCTHDGTGGSCSWESTAEHGTIPSYVPDMK